MLPSTGFMDCSAQRALLRVAGPDAARFLHGQCTQDIQGMAVGVACHAFVLSPKGKILGEFHVLRTEAEFYLFVAREEADALFSHLRKYIIIQKLTLERVSDVTSLLFIGEVAAALVKSDPDMNDEHGIGLKKNQGKVEAHGLVVRWDRYGAPDWEWVMLGEKGEGVSRIRVLASVLGIPEWNENNLESYRIRQGIPIFHRDFTEENLPQETGLEDCLHFNKGCYTGQEIVARLHFRGHVNKGLAHLSLHADGLTVDEVKALHFEIAGKSWGPMTSVTQTTSGHWQGLIYLPFLFFEQEEKIIQVVIHPEIKISSIKKIAIA